MRDAVQRSLINIHDGAVHVSWRHGSKTRPSLTYFQCRLRFLHSRRYCFLPSISRPLLCWSRCGTIPNFDKNQRSKSQFFIQTLLEEILKKSYHKSGWIIGSTDPYITLKKNQKMICDPRFVVRPTLIFTTAEEVLFASAVNYKLRFTSLPLFNMLKEREK